MARLTWLALIGTLVALMCTACSADWPRFLGPNANGIAPDTGINKNWDDNPPQKNDGYAGPSVADGKVFIIDHSGDQDIVRALDLKDGNEVWRFSYKDTGKHNYGFARSTPTYADGKLYTISPIGNVHCLNAANGSKIWSMNMQQKFGGQKPTWHYSMSAVLDGDKLILCPGGQTGVVAVNKNTGETIWARGNQDAPGYSTPAIATIQGVKQYVVFSATELVGVEADTGKLLWRVPWETKYNVNAATPLVMQDFIFITSGYNHGCTLIQMTPNGPKPIWENRELMAHFNSPIFYNNCFFGISDSGGMACINPRDGKALWRERSIGNKGGIVGVDDTIIALHGKRGEVVMFSNSYESPQILGRMAGLGGQSWTAPIVADGKLIVRNKQAIACYDLM